MEPFTTPDRRTVVAHGRMAMRERRLRAAREREQGLQVMPFERLAARLAGGFARPIDPEQLRETIQLVLPNTELGELDGIKQLPGLIDAAAGTLDQAWQAGLDLADRAEAHPRISSIRRLEKAVLAHLPAGMMRPADLVTAARLHLAHALAVLGPVEIVGITELSPAWRPLLLDLARHVPVRWIAGPRSVPTWLDGSEVVVERTEPQSPEIRNMSASSAYHEAIEALRWARELLASGQAEPGDIAIAATTTDEYDDHFLALRADSNLDLHFGHGIKVTATRPGQMAAALADILIRGLSSTRMRRLANLLDTGPFRALPPKWTRVMPADAPLASPAAWKQLLGRLTPADWPDERDHNDTLQTILSLLEEGLDGAAGVGQELLNVQARAIWDKALRAGPPAALDTNLESLRQDDGLEACVSVAWMPASALAASPRPHVRLLGLNSLRWPRAIAEDRLLADHIIATAELNPLTIAAADRRDFETILATTPRQVGLSRARRDQEGRRLGRSVLLQGQPQATYLLRHAVPSHALSETDRLLARPKEFAGQAQAQAAKVCWRNWRRPDVTPHDGLVRADHPVLQAMLERTQSASSLRRLLRNPLGYVWQYAMRWREPARGTDPLALDALSRGDLVHQVLDRALQHLEAGGGWAGASEAQITQAIEAASAKVTAIWQSERPVPPPVIWTRTLQDVHQMAEQALKANDPALPEARSYSEVPFGGAQPKSAEDVPWDIEASVAIPETGLSIAGYIDRLDVAGQGQEARVCDYKTGRKPKHDPGLDKGKELQRCLYTFAVQTLLGERTEVTASLHYLREPAENFPLDDPAMVLEEMAGYLQTARTNLLAGKALLGPDTGDPYDELRFALPANVANVYRPRKQQAAYQRLGETIQTLWGTNR